MNKPQLIFEKLATEPVRSVYRARVPGGWVVVAMVQTGAVNMMNADYPAGLAFIPDPTHTWDGGSLP